MKSSFDVLHGMKYNLCLNFGSAGIGENIPDKWHNSRARKNHQCRNKAEDCYFDAKLNCIQDNFRTSFGTKDIRLDKAGNQCELNHHRIQVNFAIKKSILD